MANDDPYNTRELSPAELVSMGLLPAGPLAPAIQSSDPDKNLAGILTMVNPPPPPPRPIGTLLTAEEQAQSPEVQEAGKNFLKVMPRGGYVGDLLTQLPMAGRTSSFLGNLALNALASGAPEAMRGGSSLEDVGKATAIGAGGGALLQGGGNLLRYLGSRFPARAFATKTADELAEWFSKNVPEWKDIKNLAGQSVTGEKALNAMAKGEGIIKLQDAYDKALLAAKDAIPEGTRVEFPEEIAKALKLKISGAVSPKIADLLQAAGKDVPPAGVDARELLSKLPGSEGVTRTAIREALGGYVPPDMLKAYKAGMGLVDMAKHGFLKGEQYDPVKAMEAVDTYGAEELLKRGLREPAAIMRGPLADPMTRQTPSSLPWYAGKFLAGTGAGILGATHGNPLLGGATGLAMTMLPKPAFYRNVPPMLPPVTPGIQQGLRVVMPGFLGNMQSSQRED